ncbi:MAG TPA: VWA domain-containing protein [Anaerolineales bacterium]
MGLLWPGFLVLLGLIPVMIGGYIWMLRRRRRFTVRYSSLTLVREALPRYSFVRRHLPFALFLLATASLVIAMTRPVKIISVPTDQTTIILTLDVSGSMRSRDIQPSRLEAAEAAALSFIQRQKSSTQIGVVAFSGFAELIQPPTMNQEALQAAVESLTTGRRTAIGSGILKSLDAIAEVDKKVAPSVSDLTTGNEPTPVPLGAYAPDIIVLLTDGVSNVGPLPLDAAQQAVDRGVRIYTIGFGTQNGSVPFDNQQSQGGGFFGGGNQPPQGGGGFFGGGGGFGGRFRAGIDEATLKQIASMTGGAYYSASSAGELQNVFRNLPTYLIMKHEATEISVFFAAAGALLVALAIIFSLAWHPLP